MKRILALVKSEPLNSTMLIVSIALTLYNVDLMQETDNPMYAMGAGYGLFATYLFAGLLRDSYKKMQNQK